VFLNAPLEVCEARDPKGRYKLARAGKIKGNKGTNLLSLSGYLQSLPITKGNHLQVLLALMILMNHHLIVRLAKTIFFQNLFSVSVH
jgi:hypothetical protein